jgi:hypothetical protein
MEKGGRSAAMQTTASINTSIISLDRCMTLIVMFVLEPLMIKMFYN